MWGALLFGGRPPILPTRPQRASAGRLAGMMLAFAASAHAEVSYEGDKPWLQETQLPDAMMGSWSLGHEEGIMERVGADSGDFNVEKDKYSGVDSERKILHVEKLAENLYTVQASCAYPDGGGPATIDTSEFELLGKDKLRVSPVRKSMLFKPPTRRK